MYPQIGIFWWNSNIWSAVVNFRVIQSSLQISIMYYLHIKRKFSRLCWNAVNVYLIIITFAANSLNHRNIRENVKTSFAVFIPFSERIFKKFQILFEKNWQKCVYHLSKLTAICRKNQFLLGFVNVSSIFFSIFNAYIRDFCVN